MYLTELRCNTSIGSSQPLYRSSINSNKGAALLLDNEEVKGCEGALRPSLAPQPYRRREPSS